MKIVYGARCSWWDDINKANKNEVGLPCCPFCGSVLFETDLESWNVAIAVHDKKHPGYKKVVQWMKGKCFLSYEVAQKEYDRSIH
jgi:hypothetical protein